MKVNHFSNDYFLPTCIFFYSIWFAIFEFAWSEGLKLAWSKCPSVCVRSILDQSLQRCHLWWFIVDHVLFMNMALCIQFSLCLQKWRQKKLTNGWYWQQASETTSFTLIVKVCGSLCLIIMGHGKLHMGGCVKVWLGCVGCRIAARHCG